MHSVAGYPPEFPGFVIVSALDEAEAESKALREIVFEDPGYHFKPVHAWVVDSVEVTDLKPKWG